MVAGCAMDAKADCRPGAEAALGIERQVEVVGNPKTE